MSVLTAATLPVAASRASGTDVDPIHLVCCCDQNLALCGEDVSDVPWADDYDQPCPLCCFAFEAEERCGHCGCAGDCGNPIHD